MSTSTTMPTPGLRHAARVSSKRNDPMSGKEVSDFLLKHYQEAHPDKFPDFQDPDNTASQKWRMFCEIITRNAFDIIGNRYSRAEDGSQFSSFDGIFEDLAKQGIEGPAALDKVLKHLPAYTKGYVQTPHPTEVLTDDGIAAEQSLHKELEHNRALFNGKFHPDAEAGELDRVLKAMDRLYNEIVPVPESMKPIDEMRRSIKFSKKMFDAVPMIAQAVLDAAARHDAYQKGEKLTQEQLMAFNFLLQPDTWSPGDRDSKSEMTAVNLQAGIDLNKRSVLLHYVEKIAEIVADPGTKEGINPETGEKTQVKAQLREMMYKLMNDLNVYDIQEKLDTEWKSKLNPAALKEIKRLYEIKLTPDSSKAKRLEDVFHRAGVELEHESYSGTANNPKDFVKEFLDDLQAVHAARGASIAPYRFPKEQQGSSDLSSLDALYIQANNFGGRALRAQIRENAEMHGKVMEMVLETLHERGIRITGYDPADSASAHRPEVVEAALDALMDPAKTIVGHKRAIAGEKAMKQAKEDITLGEHIHEVIQEKLESVRDSVMRAQDTLRGGTPPSRQDKANMELYETLKGFEVATQNPQAIPRYLIAECHGSTDILEAFFLLKMMEPDAVRNRLDRPKVEIIPLFEHRGDVEKAPEAVVEAYQNPYFRHHHNSITHRDDPAIVDHARAEANHLSAERRISVAEMKRISHLPVKAGDEEARVMASKTTMFAGSDVTKSAGCAGAGLVLYTTRRLREKLLDLTVPDGNGELTKNPVTHDDYTGAGCGPSRTQLVSTLKETVQGRGMRQSDFSIAQKTQMVVGARTRRRMGLENGIDHLSPREKALTAQLHLGNLKSMPIRDDYWMQEGGTRDRLNADMDKYQALYRDDEFKSYMGFTANQFGKITSYAARSGFRVGSAGDRVGCGAPVDVTNLRAIGYGAALNASGSCMSLYYGASETMQLDERGKSRDPEKLQELYLNDPIIQDRLNRATFGAVMANMNTAWAYLGCERQEDHGQVRIKRGDGSVIARDELLKALGPNASDEEKAMHALAKIDQEYQKVSAALVQLHREVRRQAGIEPKSLRETDELTKEVPSLDTTQRQLFAELPKALREQLLESRKQVDPARDYLARTFREVVEGTRKEPDRKSDNYAQIYHAMGALFECFENIPRAYTRIDWAIAQEMPTVAMSSAGHAPTHPPHIRH